MKITPDDPRLTAYALGELDPTERDAIEAELQKSFVLQQAVEEIRATAALLEKQLAAEELPGLAFAQQLKIENQLKPPAARPAVSFWRILFYGGVSAAAACFIFAMLLPELSKSKNKQQQLALNSQPKTPATVPETKPAAVTPANSTTVALTPAPAEQKLQPPTVPVQPAKPVSVTPPVDIVVQSAPPAPLVQPAPAVILSAAAPPPAVTQIESLVPAASVSASARSAPANQPVGGAKAAVSDSLSQNRMPALALNGANSISAGTTGGGGGGRGGRGGGGGGGAEFNFNLS